MERSSRIEVYKKVIRLDERDGKETLSVRDETGWLGYVSLDNEKATINGMKEVDKEEIEEIIGNFKEMTEMEDEDAVARFVVLFERLIHIITPTGLFDELGHSKGFFDQIEETKEKGFFDRE